jgi:hypothetical protein
MGSGSYQCQNGEFPLLVVLIGMATVIGFADWVCENGQMLTFSAWARHTERDPTY